MNVCMYSTLYQNCTMGIKLDSHKMVTFMEMFILKCVFPSVGIIISKAPYCVGFPLLSLTEDLVPQCDKKK